MFCPIVGKRWIWTLKEEYLQLSTQHLINYHLKHLLSFSCQSPGLQLLPKEVGKMCEFLLSVGAIRQGLSVNHE